MSTNWRIGACVLMRKLVLFNQLANSLRSKLVRQLVEPTSWGTSYRARTSSPTRCACVVLQQVATRQINNLQVASMLTALHYWDAGSSAWQLLAASQWQRFPKQEECAPQALIAKREELTPLLQPLPKSLRFHCSVLFGEMSK